MPHPDEGCSTQSAEGVGPGELKQASETAPLNADAPENAQKVRELQDMIELKALDNIFTYHAPKGNQQERYVALREKAKELATLVIKLTPKSRERSLAITAIQQSTMWANSAIAINEG